MRRFEAPLPSIAAPVGRYPPRERSILGRKVWFVRTKAAVFLSFLLILSGCQPAPEPVGSWESCWPALLDAHSAIYYEFDQGSPSAEAIAGARAVLRERLRACEPTDSYYGTPEDVTIENGGIVSLFDMAIIADDPELVRQYADGDPVEGNEMPERGLLLYAEQFIQVGAFYESRNALRELGALGHDPRAPDEYGGTALHLVNAYTSTGLQLIRDFVSAGIDVNARTERGITPLMAARLRGDLTKARCLVALGAEIPVMEAFDPWTVEPHRDAAVAAVDAFLMDEEREIPTDVLTVCLR